MRKLRGKFALELQDPQLCKISLSTQLLALLQLIKKSKDEGLKPLRETVRRLHPDVLENDPLKVVADANPHILITHNWKNFDASDQPIPT